MVAAVLLSIAPLHARAPLYDPSALNIGISCQWQQSCMRAHIRSMKKALKYVAKYKPPYWRIQLCNRNAARGGLRVDWVGFDHCVRNDLLRPPPPPPPPRSRQARHKHRAAKRSR